MGTEEFEKHPFKIELKDTSCLRSLKSSRQLLELCLIVISMIEFHLFYCPNYKVQISQYNINQLVGILIEKGILQIQWTLEL